MKAGFFLRELRKEKRRTKHELAALAGIDRSYQGKIERGETSISVGVLDLLAQKLGLKNWEPLRKLEKNGN